MKVTRIWISALALVLSGSFALASLAVEKGEFDPAAWDLLVRNYVSETGVDYASWHQDGASELDAFLEAAGAYDMKSTFGKEPKAGYLINVYNAWVVRQILEHYPLESPKDIPGFFDKNEVKVGGEAKPLDAIEAQVVKLFPHNPEILFLLAPGAAGMPTLQNTAYTAEDLRERATTAAALFLGGTSPCSFNEDRKTFVVTEALEKSFHIFDDYPGGLRQFVGTYTPLQALMALIRHSEGGAPNIEFRKEDWSLNQSSPSQAKDGKP